MLTLELLNEGIFKEPVWIRCTFGQANTGLRQAGLEENVNLALKSSQVVQHID